MLLYFLCFIGAILLGPGKDQFIDLPAIVLVILSIYFCMAIAYDFKEPFKLLSDMNKDDLSKEMASPHIKACKCGFLAAVVVSVTIFFVGVVQMLQGMHDPAILGPALATALLSPLYALILMGVFFLPLKFHYEKLLDN